MSQIAFDWLDRMIWTSIWGAMASLIALLVAAGSWLTPRQKVWVWRAVLSQMLLVFVIGPISLSVTSGLTVQNGGEFNLSGLFGVASLTLFTLWLSQVFYKLAVLVVRSIKIRRLLAVGRPVTGPTYAVARELSGKLKLKKTPSIIQVEGLASPLAIGSIHPAIALPAGISISEADVRFIIAHEMAHIQSRDLDWSWALAAFETLLAFHPLTELVARNVGSWTETAADLRAMEVLDTTPDKYAAMLLR